MARVRALLPRTVLQRVRLAALLFACSAPVSQLPIGMDPSLSRPVQVRGLVALLLLLVFYVVTFARRRVPPAGPIVLGVLILVAGFALLDPMAVIGLCMGAMVHQSLYVGRREAILRTITVNAAYLLTIALSAAAAQRGLHPGSSVVVTTSSRACRTARRSTACSPTRSTARTRPAAPPCSTWTSTTSRSSTTPSATPPATS